MSIFAKPQESNEIIDENVFPKVLFLHGLEGSPQGSKSVHLKKKWGAKSPALRSHLLREARTKSTTGEWKDIPKRDFERSWDAVYSDALSAVEYYNPDIVIGSSMGGALLAKMCLEGKWEGSCVFLAPAIKPLLGDVHLPKNKHAVWILGEADDIVPNADNINHALDTGGQLVISEADSHRLHKALETGLIDNAVITLLEIKSNSKPI
tara:strand:- start:16438 stop:17061 length:624 start_codon:yes stop_codon:yes gene_type:complete